MPEKRNTSIRILLKKDTAHYLMGRLDITTPQNEFYYRPSNKIISEYGIGTISETKEEIDLPITSFDHISFHSDGRVHLKNTEVDDSEIILITSTQRLDIKSTGFVHLLWDAVGDIENLPVIDNSPNDIDIVKEVNPSNGLIMKICLIASTNLLNKNIELVNPEEGFICWENRGTANPQRMVSLIFCKYTLPNSIPRRIFIPKMKGIHADIDINQQL